MALNETIVSKAKRQASGQTFIHDDRVPGLALRVTANGAKAYTWTGRIHGVSRRITLGKASVMSLAAARAEAHKTAAAVHAGQDPAAAKAAEKGEATFGGLAVRFMEYARAHKKPKSVHEDHRMLRDCLPAVDGQEYDADGLIPKGWATRRLWDISRAVVGQLHARVGQDSGHYAANRGLALISKMFNLAKVWDLCTGDNPTVGIKRFRERRARTLPRPGSYRGCSSRSPPSRP